MHIEPGLIDPLRVTAANAAALAVVATQIPALVRAPLNIVKAGLAAVVFSVLMQAWHLPVGPSELHLIGATTVYLLFGFAPSMVGFALGLFLQGFFFEPQDLVHLGVNSLSLMLPLIAVHETFGKRLFAAHAAERFSFARVLRIDAVYYAGVSAMVGFWLMISNDGFALADWGRWALAYMPVFGIEALITFTTVTVMETWRNSGALSRFTEIGRLTFA
ncbi:energy-coupling factor ABC transporter permease [Rhizobium sp. C4]|uniref:energy-coupling factor ABC transporter permease n=1 Tax=Rhizobium sp. C4 TaxID=1349800 RepID=UPI001E5B1CC3|nr:energy-coupling factor ABC transporter permease [Rhizobium sp. C4]MCD2175560.1 energy-coupling factor ABC transporter permease [Rhizobium sp. C4]